MSLINDALRRANEACNARQQSNDSPPLQLPKPTVPSAHYPSWSVFGVALLLALTLILAGVLISGAWRQQTPMPTLAEVTQADPSEAPISSPLVTPLVAQPVVAPESKVEPPAEVSSPALETSAMSETVEAPLSSSALTVEEAPPVSIFPELKLQSILYRPKAPGAMINGRYVQAGSRLEEVEVVSIDRQSVVVDYHGSNRVLRLSDY